ncbi:MAG: hypothetical protein ACO1NO_00500 [Burkholderiaceae bacterium]
MNKVLIQIFLALLSLIAAVYCFLWIFSATSLAPAACYGDFALFHTELRCREPYIAMILCAACSAAVVLLGISAYKNIKGNRDAHGKS